LLGSGAAVTTTLLFVRYQHLVSMRAVPSLSSTAFSTFATSYSRAAITAIALESKTILDSLITFTTNTASVLDKAYMLEANNTTSAKVEFSAEL
jgi:hypothetical protein